MPNRCIVGGCSNVPSRGVVLHAWPTIQSVARKWNAFVDFTRKDWKVGRVAPTLCSDHFKKPDDYTNYPKYMCGYAARLLLKPNAVPSILPSSLQPSPTIQSNKVTDKLESARLSENFAAMSKPCLKATVSTQTVSTQTEQQVQENATQTWAAGTDDDCSGDYVPPRKKQRKEVPKQEDEERVRKLEDKESVDKKEDEESMQYLVHHSALISLFQSCTSCHAHAPGMVQNITGMLIEIQQMCDVCGHVRSWKSQPLIRRMPLANLMVSGASLFCGLGFAKVARFMSYMNVPMISKTTYYRHQREFVFPTVFHAWDGEKEQLNAELPEHIELAGDCRSDSPGFSAKYGAYTVIEQGRQKVLDIQVVQKNEAGSSQACELLGLQRTLEQLGPERVSLIVTDRHRGIAKYLREQQPHIKHRFDVWHVAKSVGKKLSAAAKKKGTEDVGLWGKGVKNHLYFSVLSSEDDDGEMKEAKWTSIVNHVRGIHQHDNNRYPQCLHDEIEREWLQDDSESFEKLESIVLNKALCKDIQAVSSRGQTSSLEAFHSLVIQYCPKSHAYSYLGMKCRMILAALHFNENSNRDQAVTEDGLRRYAHTFSKASKEFVIKKVKTASTYNFGHMLMQSLIGLYTDVPADLKTIQTREQALVPAPVCNNIPRGTKEDAVTLYEARHGQ